MNDVCATDQITVGDLIADFTYTANTVTEPTNEEIKTLSSPITQSGGSDCQLLCTLENVDSAPASVITSIVPTTGVFSIKMSSMDAAFALKG